MTLALSDRMLRQYRPCLPIRVSTPPSGERWVHEIKHDGFRIIARKVNGRVYLCTKQGYDYTTKYPLITEALHRMRATSIVLDGEAMCWTDGREDFDKLWSNCFDDAVTLSAFDLLEFNGEDLREQPLRERKRRLAELFRRDREGLHYVEHITGEGERIFEHACKLRLEGIVSKLIDRPYRAGPSKAWVKAKNRAHPALMRVKEAFELVRSGRAA